MWNIENIWTASTQGDLAFRTRTGTNASAERLRIANGGNVGIGTTSPSQLLSVHGNGLFSGNLSAANITATGTATIGSLSGLLQGASGVVSAVTGTAAVDNMRRQAMIRPWLFIGPALLILIVYLIYPVIQTLYLSFHDRAGENFVGTANYAFVWAMGGENTDYSDVVPAPVTELR